MRKILVVVDMQKDFIDGALGFEGAEKVIPGIAAKIKTFEEAGDEVVYTLDTHFENYMETQEGKYLPVEHCIRNTEGWKIRPDIAAELKHAAVYEKPTFGSTAMAEHLRQVAQHEEISLELIGLCTDICVISNALMLKAYMPEVPIKVDSSCCAGVTVEKHLAALETMRSCQIEVI